MAPKSDKSIKNIVNKGAWTAEEDQKLAQFIEIHGGKKWKTVAAKAGLNRCAKSCRLRWLNYLRPDIKRGSFSEQEEDLIFRLHKLLGNRWSLIAGRLPGRTDNDVKNYWNSHLSKKINKKEKPTKSSMMQESRPQKTWDTVNVSEECKKGDWGLTNLFESFDVDEFFDFSSEANFNLEWMNNNFLELDENFFDFHEMEVLSLS